MAEEKVTPTRKKRRMELKTIAKEWKKRYFEKLKENKEKNKRKTNNYLNSHVSGYHRHHLDKKNIISIPEYLHKSYKHRQSDEKAMLLINMAAWDYLEASAL